MTGRAWDDQSHRKRSTQSSVVLRSLLARGLSYASLQKKQKQHTTQEPGYWQKLEHLQCTLGEQEAVGVEEHQPPRKNQTGQEGLKETPKATGKTPAGLSTELTKGLDSGDRRRRPASGRNEGFWNSYGHSDNRRRPETLEA